MIFFIVVAALMAMSVSGQNVTALRPATSTMTDPDIDQLRTAWQSLVAAPQFTQLVSDPFASHGQLSFLAWHRHSLSRFEEAMKRPVPYWDFSLEPIPSMTLEPRVHSKNQPNPLYSTTRKPATPYPTETLLLLELMAFAQLDFSHLSILLENLFETVLASLGGSVATLDTAPRDILYWMTLANIDRIWWRWSLNHNSTEPPPAATRELKDLGGPFNGANVVNDSSRWDPNGEWRQELERRAAHPERRPTDGHVDGDLMNASRGAHVAMMMRVGHIQSHLGDSAYSADNSERSYQGTVISGNGTNPGLGGLGMTTSDNHEWHTEDVPAPNISSATGWVDNAKFYGSVPGEGAIHGLDGDPVPPTGNNLDVTSHSGKSMPGPVTQTDERRGQGEVNATAPRMRGTTGELSKPDGKGYTSVAHNSTHFTDVKPPRGPGDKSKIVASVAWSFAGNWGWANASSPPMYMSSTSSLPLKSLSSATHSMAVQQETMGGEEPTKVKPDFGPPPPPSNDTTYPYETVSELFDSPPKLHMILSLCEVPVSESPFRVEIVARNSVIGVIFIEGSGALRTNYLRDRPVDITEGYQSLLKQIPLEKLQNELMILVYNEKTGKMVKTPKFTVRLDQYVF